eukprot:Nitzschia sp. Nitz4//scaffold213_size37731//12328//13095//NITZ4_007717-RA/size37731-processed-gene-0.46-mRNA-1//-1//CDS//3329542056//8860//frame0
MSTNPSESSSQTQITEFPPVPREQWELLSQGAEGKVWKVGPCVCKERLSKAYRHPDLDERLTKSRCRSEARILEKCIQKSDLLVPRVLRVEPPLLYMEYWSGPTLKNYLQEKYALQKNAETPSSFDYNQLARSMGEMIAKLHNLGVVHGDLTTSNMMVVGKSNDSNNDNAPLTIGLIDFGLAKSTTNVEEQAVDLYVLERALESTHSDLPDSFVPSILEGYNKVSTPISEKKSSQTTLQRLEQVRLRGRKRECFG